MDKLMLVVVDDGQELVEAAFAAVAQATQEREEVWVPLMHTDVYVDEDGDRVFNVIATTLEQAQKCIDCPFQALCWSVAE